MPNLSFVRTEMTPARPAPVTTTGVVGWIRENLFSSVPNAIMTLIGIYLVYLVLPPTLNFLILDAAWSGKDRDACDPVKVGREVGACWPYVQAKFAQFIYGQYTISERWRVDVTWFLFFAALIPMAMPSLPYKKANAIFLLVVWPLLAIILLTGGAIKFSMNFFIILMMLLIIGGITLAALRKASGDPVEQISKGMIPYIGISFGILAAFWLLTVDFGLKHVETTLWGGLLVTLVVSVTGIVASLPFGILLALGRRSDLPIIKFLSVVFIEFWRGVPIITVLFMASVMLPLFLPPEITVDKLMRALVGVAIFSAAYMAEVVRGGLQAVPKGQYEGAMALGLPYWKMMGLIVLPQALRIVIPGIVNNFIALFKDTTLVLIIGIFDLLGMVKASLTDPNWAAPTTNYTGLIFAGFVFWVFCFIMSRYSIFIEERLTAGQKR